MASRVDESARISGRRGIAASPPLWFRPSVPSRTPRRPSFAVALQGAILATLRAQIASAWVIWLASMVVPTRLRGPRAKATAPMLMRLGLLGIGLGAFMLAGSRVPAIAGEAEIELLGAGWPTTTITYLIDAGGGVARPAIEDVREAVEDWNIALALTNLSNGQVIQFVPADGARRDIVISLEIAPGPVGSLVFRRTLTPFSCELAGARVELRGEALGGSERGVGTRNVARHALGHVLGLGHSDDPGSIMRFSGDTASGFRGNDVAIQECEASRLWMLHPPIECPLPPLTLCY